MVKSEPFLSLINILVLLKGRGSIFVHPETMKPTRMNLKALSLILKIGMASWAVWYLYDQLILKGKLQDALTSVSYAHHKQGFWPGISIVVLGMFLNWGIEAYKWRFMISRLEPISFLRSLEAVVTGVTLSFFTPNRIGEFAGRIFFLEKTDKVTGLLVSSLSSISQLVVTLATGSVALIFFTWRFYHFEPLIGLLVTFLASLVFFFLLVLYLYAGFLNSIVVRLNLWEKLKKALKVLDYFPARDLAKTLALSWTRYFVFSTQFFILLTLMDVKVPFLAGLMMIALTYLALSIPAFALAELGFRSAVAVFFIGMISGNEGGIISASILLYLLNVAFPALIGIPLVFDFRIFRKTKAI